MKGLIAALSTASISRSGTGSGRNERQLLRSAMAVKISIGDLALKFPGIKNDFIKDCIKIITQFAWIQSLLIKITS